MRKIFTKTICLILLFFLSVNAFSQTVWDTLPWKSYADYRLTPLNKSYVTTGVLYDRVFPIAHMDEHTGLLSSEDTTSSDHFKQGFYEMYNSTYSPSGYSPDDVDNILDTFTAWHGHPIGILYYKFNSLDTNALQDHLVDTLSNGQFTDVSGRPRSPYFNNTAFLAAPLIAEDEVYEKGVHKFFIDSRFFLHNASAHVTQVRIDFGDGQGEWIVNNPFDSTTYFNKGINSPSSVVSSISKLIGGTVIGRIVVVLVDALGYTIQYSNPFKIIVPGGKSDADYAPLTACKGLQKWVIEAPQSRLTAINTLYGNPQLDYSKKVVLPCPGFPALSCKVKIQVKDTAYFYFAGNGSSCTPSVLHKPIVFIDGFDPTNSRGVKQIYEDYINKIVTRNGNPNTLFGDYMLNQGYDFVVLDYKHGNDLMERNALTLVSLLERLYQTYGSTFQQDITLIGPSMGSEVAQYALAYMEHNNIPHHVKTYISFDGPQQGANVPIGLQNMVEYLTKRGLLSKLKSVKSNIRNGLYNGLAARQLIAHHVSANAQFPTPDALRTKFLNNLQTVGTYPTLCRKVALINGVSNGILNPDHLTFNESLLHIINKRRGWKSIWGLCNANICKSLDWEVKGAPDYGSAKVMDMWTLNPIINLIFWVPPGEINKYASAAWGNSSLENAPGSTFGKIFGNQGGNIDQNKIAFWLKELFYLLTGSKRTTFTQNINSFTFIPSYSSADLRFPSLTDNSAKNLNMDWSNTYLCGHTPFDYVYAPKNISEQHVTVSQQGSEWFESEVRCNRSDLPVLFSPVINGPSNLCNTTQNYSVSFCQAGNHNITWSVGNTSIVTIGGSGDQISLTSHLNGITTLTATITYPCSYSSTPPIVITKQVTVGPPVITSITSSMTGSCNGTYQEWFLNAYANSSVTNWHWAVDNPANNNWVIYNPNQANTLVAVTGGGGISVTATNACGTSKSGVTIYSNCHGLIVTPNPTADNVNVTLVQSNDIVLANKKSVIIYEVRVTDLTGNLKKQYNYSGGVNNANINLSGLNKGIYIIRAFDGTTWSSEKIVKE